MSIPVLTPTLPLKNRNQHFEWRIFEEWVTPPSKISTNYEDHVIMIGPTLGMCGCPTSRRWYGPRIWRPYIPVIYHVQHGGPLENPQILGFRRRLPGGGLLSISANRGPGRTEEICEFPQQSGALICYLVNEMVENVEYMVYR